MLGRSGVSLQQAIFSVRQGDLAEAESWIQKWALTHDVSPDPHPSLDESQDTISAHLRKYQQIVLARLFIRQEKAAEALALLETLLSQVNELGRIDLTIEIQILRALAFQILCDSSQAMDALAQALSLAAPGGYVRIFLDEGEPLARLLRQAAMRKIAPAYTAQLLATSGELEFSENKSGRFSLPTNDLIDLPSERELEVLRMLAAGMSNRDIADELVVTVSTVHSHCKSIYSKLDVHSRFSAVQRARELGLI